MSLVSLTFGNSKRSFSNNYTHIDISRPWERFKTNSNEENRVVVKKACRFYNVEETYIVGQVLSGIVSTGMKGSINGKQFTVVDMECKMDAPIAGKGMFVGLLVSGIDPVELQKDSEMTFAE